MSAEELYDQVKKQYPGIGYATVYRTLKLLSKAGLAKENRFENILPDLNITTQGNIKTILSVQNAA